MNFRKCLSVVACAAIAIGAIGPAPVHATQDAAQSVLAERAELDAALAANPEDRVAKLEKFLTDHPTSLLADQAREALVRSYATFGEIALKNGDPKAAADAFRRALEAAGPKISNRLFQQVIWQMPVVMAATGYRFDSIELMRTFEKRFEAEPERLIQIGFFYVSVEAPNDAVRILEHAVELAPNDHRAYNSLGTAYIISLRLDDAATAFLKAIEIEPKEEFAYASLANLRNATGNPVEAIELYKKQIEVKPDEPESYGGLAVAYLLNDQETEASNALAQSLALSPRNFRLYTQLAYYYVSRGRYDKAKEMVDLSLRIEPRFAWTHIVLGNILLGQKRYKEAIEAFNQAQNYGDFPTLHFEAAKAYMVDDQFDQAIDQLNATADVTETGEFETSLGDVLTLKSSRLDLLLDRERQAVLFMPVQPTTSTQFRLAEALARIGHYLELIPDPPPPVTAPRPPQEPPLTTVVSSPETLTEAPVDNNTMEEPPPSDEPPADEPPPPARGSKSSGSFLFVRTQEPAPDADAEQTGQEPPATEDEGGDVQLSDEDDQQPAAESTTPESATQEPASEPAAAKKPDAEKAPAKEIISTDPRYTPTDTALVFHPKRSALQTTVAVKPAHTGEMASVPTPTGETPSTSNEPSETAVDPQTGDPAVGANDVVQGVPNGSQDLTVDPQLLPAPTAEPEPFDPNGRAIDPAIREQLLAAIDAFVSVDDGREPFRRIWVARQLTEKGVLLDKAEDLARQAVNGAEAATELEQSVRDLPNLDREQRRVVFTARALDTLGWTLLKRRKTDEAVDTLSRSIEGAAEGPEQATRMWHLAVAKQQAGREQEALDLYIKAYNPAAPGATLRKSVIEDLYRKVHGSTDGLDAMLTKNTQ